MRSEGVRQDDEVLEAFGQIIAAISRGQHRDAVIELIAACARRLVDADLAGVTLRAGPGELITIAADGVEADLYRGQTYPAEGTFTEKVLETGEALMIDNLSAVPIIGTRLPGVPLGPAIWVPITIDGPHGSLNVSRLAGRLPYTEADLQLTRSFAAQAALVLQLDAERQRQARVERVADQLRIANELQDKAITELWAASMTMSRLCNEAEDPEQRELAVLAIDTVDHAIKLIRQIVFGIGEQAADPEAGELVP